MKKTKRDKTGRRKIVWDKEREPSGSYNHVGYVTSKRMGKARTPEYWIFHFGEHYRADFFPYTGLRAYIGETKFLPRAKRLCRRHLKSRRKAEKALAKQAKAHSREV